MKKFVKILSLLTIAVGLEFGLAACGGNTKATKLEASKAAVEVTVGKEKTVTLTVEPKGAKVEVSVDKKEIATATLKDNVITIKGVKEGDAEVTVKAKAKEGKVDDLVIKVTVKKDVVVPVPAPEVKATKLAASEKAVVVTVDKEKTVTLTVEPKGAKVEVSVDKKEIATATLKDNVITIKGVKEGEAEVTVKAKAKEGKVDDLVIKVTVKKK